ISAADSAVRERKHRCRRDDRERALVAKESLMKSRAKDWRAETLARMRALILEADPGMIEERKWAKATNPSGVPVWSHEGMVCTGETYKDAVKLTFAKGASLPDPSRVFNASLDAGTR